VNEVTHFGEIVLVVAAGFSLALAARVVAERVAVPAAALILVAAAVASDLVPSLGDAVSIRAVERIAVVALIVILFDGGMRIGWRRFRASAAPILSLGVLGTFATAGLVACAAHWLLGFSWTIAGVIGAALAPTDPAVTFSVLGGREIRGRTGTIIEGESGANDPVGIALMIGMIELATSDGGSVWSVVREFSIEMAVGAAVGAAGAAALLPVLRRLRLPEPPLYPLLVLAAAGVVYGAAALAHGSGFLAVFVAGVLVGDATTPRKGEIETFHSSLASMAEIAAFVGLGLTINLAFVWDEGLWVDGLVLAALLGLVIRPLVIGTLLLPVRLRWGERVFVMWSGLKGAVPILLAARLYAIVFVVVLLSVVVQGSLVPVAAARLHVPMRRVEHATAAVRRFLVGSGTIADGAEVATLPLAERAWLSALVRDGTPQAVLPHTVLAAGDEVHVYCEDDDEPAVRRIVEGAP
jgi:cell volume regulation protein A